jgi:transmembrane sensor
MKTPADDRVNFDSASADELQKQARVWLRLLTSDDVKACDAQGFQRWLRTSAAHAAAFGEVKRRWEILEPASREFLHRHPQDARAHQRALHGNGHGRRAFLGAAVAGAAAMAGAAVVYPPFGLWPAPAEWDADDRTATGEQRTLALAQQVTVTLNTQTSIRRRNAGGQTTGIDLLTGEAAIDFPAGGRRAFSVLANGGRSSAESGRFEVRYLADKVCVSCIEGNVRVQHPAGSRTLSARQQTIYDTASISGIASIEPAQVSAWRSGALMFNDVRLIDAIGEINRYRPGHVVLMKTALRDSPVSGRFLIASLDGALAQLQQMFDLHGRALPGGLLILS